MHCHKIRRGSLAMPAALMLLAMGALCGFERIPDRFDCIPLPPAFEERPESCVNLAWCACVEVDFPNPEAGEATALHQWQTYAVGAPIPGVHTLWVDRGTLNLELLKPDDVLAHLTIDFMVELTGAHFLMEFQFVVQNVSGDSADFDFILVESNDDTREILGYDFQDQFHSGGLLYKGTVTSFGSGKGFELFYELIPEEPGALRAIEAGDLENHGLNLPVAVSFFDPNCPPGPLYTLPPEGGLITVRSSMSQRLDPGVFKQFVAEIPIEPAEVTPFRRGDVDGNGVANLTDAVRLLGHLFSGGPAPGCPDAADVDDDGTLSLNDAVFTLNWLFRPGTDEPLPPGPTTCGADPNADDLDSCQYDGC